MNSTSITNLTELAKELEEPNCFSQFSLDHLSNYSLEEFGKPNSFIEFIRDLASVILLANSISISN